METQEGGGATREALAYALKRQLEQMPLSRVTVTALVREAGLTRQTFYNHFADVRELAAWVFTVEVENHVMEHATYDEWADGFTRLLVYLKAHHEQTYAVIDSLGHAELERFLYRSLRRMMEAIVTEIGSDVPIRPVDRDFVIDHFTLATLGHLLHWLATDMRADPVRLVDDLEYLMHGSVRRALERFATER